MPGLIIAHSSASPKSGYGDYWAASNIQNVDDDISLIDGQTYYYQLWAKVNAEDPLEQNEIFSLISYLIQK